MSFKTSLKIGQVLTNDELMKEFSVANSGGMRRSLKNNVLVIISDHTKGLYDDKYYGNELHYTGMGMKGDQELYKQQNKTLAESNSNGIEVHLFEVFKAKEYIYRGIVKLCKEPYQEKQLDEDNNERKVWMFPLIILDSEEIEEMVKSNPIINNQLEAEKADDLELEKIRLQQEYELRRLQMQMEQERLAWENSRKQASLSLIQGQGSYEKEETPKKTNPYDGFSIPPLPEYPKEDPNLQESKKEFAKNSVVDEFVLQRYLQPAISQYEVKAGTIIPLTLETAINTGLPGDLTAVVKTDIYDSKTGRVLLIPAGSRVMGKNSSDVSFGQERVQSVFNRITLPNQKSINIGSMNMVDKLGATGVKDKVDTKLGKVFTSVIMSAILGV